MKVSLYLNRRAFVMKHMFFYGAVSTSKEFNMNTVLCRKKCLLIYDIGKCHHKKKKKKKKKKERKKIYVDSSY